MPLYLLVLLVFMRVVLVFNGVLDRQGKTLATLPLSSAITPGYTSNTLRTPHRCSPGSHCSSVVGLLQCKPPVVSPIPSPSDHIATTAYRALRRTVPILLSPPNKYAGHTEERRQIRQPQQPQQPSLLPKPQQAPQYQRQGLSTMQQKTHHGGQHHSRRNSSVDGSTDSGDVLDLVDSLWCAVGWG